MLSLATRARERERESEFVAVFGCSYITVLVSVHIQLIWIVNPYSCVSICFGVTIHFTGML
jgi:hypothetical protein